MKKKVLKYLNSVDKEKYTHIDKVLKYYVEGKLEKLLLLSNKATEVTIYPSIKKNVKSIQINFIYYNMLVCSEFFEKEYWYDYYKYRKYHWSMDELSKDMVKAKYTDEFNIEEFLIEFIGLIQEDPKFKKVKININSKVKKQKDKKIRRICLFIYIFGLLLILFISLVLKIQIPRNVGILFTIIMLFLNGIAFSRDPL